jgi:hypothetical protein
MPESDLYPYVHDYLEQRFRARLKPRYGDLHSISAITAAAPGGFDDGKWSRPDLAMAALWRFKYDLGWTMDLHSFEVKTPKNCSTISVHEALSHTALVHYSYLTWHNPGWSDTNAESRAILDRCARHGVGLITFSDPPNSDTYVVRLPSIRHSPSGEAVDEFIETRFPEEERQQLRRRIEELR